MRFLLCLTFLFFALPTDNRIDHRLLPIVSEFYYMKTGKIVDDYSITVHIGKLEDPHWVGVCRQGIFGTEITIGEEFYNNNSYLQVHSTVFHELGHCVLGKGHNPPVGWQDVRSIKTLMQYIDVLRGRPVEEFMKDGCPISIMYYAQFSDYCYMKHYVEYMEELFGKK